MIAGVLVIFACGEAKKDESAPQQENTTTPADSTHSNDSTAHAAAYVCPMGPECGTGEAPGKCPSCGMELVENSK